jgi:lipoprotein-releasing system ATP-binding protein
VHKPQVVLADEPTGNLDTATANSVFALMLALNQEFQTSLVIVTHDADLASRMAKVVTIRDGQLS